MELTKEKKKENESDLSMHSWQMAKMYVCLKNKIKKESKEGGREVGEAVRKWTESCLL